MSHCFKISFVVEHFWMSHFDFLSILAEVNKSHTDRFVICVFQSHQPRASFFHDNVDLRLSETLFMYDSVFELFFQIYENEVISNIELHVSKYKLLFFKLANDSKSKNVLLWTTVSVDFVENLFALFVLPFGQFLLW